MAEESFQDKTEQPTAKKLQEARERGNVPKSQEFNSAFILLFGLLTLLILSGHYFHELITLFKSFYSDIGNMSLNAVSFRYHYVGGIKYLFVFLAPILSILFLVTIGVHIAQVGIQFSTKPLIPNLDRLNPINGLKKFVSLRTFTELIKGNLKIIIISWVAYKTLWGEKESFFLLINESVIDIFRFIANFVFKLSIRITAVFFILAVLDLIYQRWQYIRDLRMTKQDVRRETKDSEIDSHIKNAMKSVQLSRYRQRMMQSVPEADVVITNPTEIAVALKYDTENMQAPIFVAKGARLIAQKIKDVAREYNIPIVENKPLAQSLYKLGEIGKEIPFELYQAVAEIFAYVYQSKHKTI